jgi:hypothetical protein
MKTIVFAIGLLFAQNLSAQNDSLITYADTSVNADPVAMISRSYHLHDDDPDYNAKAPVWLVSGRVLASNVFNWALNRYVYKKDWTSSGMADWKNSFRKGPEWDTDKFGYNFLGHPHTGNYYFNTARSNGYSFWQSIPFAIQGSATWEWLGENERPSYNDLVNTPLSGAFLGEIFYRLSSNLLDDRKKGSERVAREALSAVFNPTRSFNRLTSGKMFRVTNREVYQKEPVFITLNGGLHKVNAGLNRQNKFATGQTNYMFQMLMDYGDPFDEIKRKPFDVFRLRIELSGGDDENVLDNIMGFGMLKGKTVRGKILKGFFQHYDYWRYNEVFEIGSMGFGVGMITRSVTDKRSALHTILHLAVVPLAGNNNPFLPDSAEARSYNFGGGLQAKLEAYFNINNRMTFGIRSYHYFITTYIGEPGNSLVGIIKPYLSVRIFNRLHLGMEHHIYHNDRYRPHDEKFHFTRTEQKFFLQWRFAEY